MTRLPDKATFVVPKSCTASGSHSAPSGPWPLSRPVSELSEPSSLPPLAQKEEDHAPCWSPGALSSGVLCLGFVVLTLSLLPTGLRWTQLEGGPLRLAHLHSVDITAIGLPDSAGSPLLPPRLPPDALALLSFWSPSSAKSPAAFVFVAF